MLYTFRVRNPEDSQFLREYTLHPCLTFLDFHLFLRQDLNLCCESIASFYTTQGDSYEPTMELTEVDMQNDTTLPAIPMESVHIRELARDEGDKFLYSYDILGERSLYLDLVHIDRDAPDSRDISCVIREGENPVPSPDPFELAQLDIQDLLANLEE